jgi:hypothetical protein
MGPILVTEVLGGRLQIRYNFSNVKVPKPFNVKTSLVNMVSLRSNSTRDGYSESIIRVSVSHRTAVTLSRNERRCNETSVTGTLLIGRHSTLGGRYK